MCGCEECFFCAEGSQGQLTPVFQSSEHAFDDVAGFVEPGVVFILNSPVPARRDAGVCSDLCQPVAQVVRVVAAVGNDGYPSCGIRLKALTGLRNIGPVACRHVQVNRAAMTIADQMQLAVQPAFRSPDRPVATTPFCAPFAAIRWALTWLASIISTERSAASVARVVKIRSNTPAPAQRR